MDIVTDPALLAELEGQAPAAPADTSGLLFQDEETRNRLAYQEAWDEDESQSWLPGGGVGRFLAGVGKPVMKLEAGLMDLLGLGDDEYKREADQALQMMDEQSGWEAGTGNVVGEAAMLAIPAAKTAQGSLALLKGTSGLTKAAGTLAAESALVGGYEGVSAPESDETRLGNALEGAAWTAVLGAPFASFRGARDSVSDTARELLDEGVPLTPGMASETGAAATAEKFLTSIPVIGPRVKKLQDRAINSWNTMLLNKSSPDYYMKGVDEPGHAGFKQVQQDFTDAYTEIWDMVTPGSINWQGLRDGFKQGYKDLELLPTGTANQAKRDLNEAAADLNNFASGKASPEMLKIADKKMRQRLSEADDQVTRDFYQRMRDNITNALEESTAQNLRTTDGLYRDFKTIEKAGSYVKAQEMGAIFSPRNLESAVKAKSSPSMTTKGQGGPMQDEAAKATATISQVLPGRSEISTAADVGRWGSVLGVASAPGVLLTLPFQPAVFSETMRKLLTGKPLTSLQEEAAAAMRQVGVTTMEELEMGLREQ